MRLRDSLLRFLRVPPAPSAPAGDEGVRVFRAAPNYFRYRIAQWILAQAGALFGLGFGVMMLRQAYRVIPEDIEVGLWTFTEDTILGLFVLVEIVAIAVVVGQAAISLALLRLDFEQRWYLVSDRSLRIREGLVRLHEKTMTFANIQQVSIRQGPIQRLLGIADLEVRTAGGGGGGTDESGSTKHDLHVGYFRGVAESEKIRDAIRERLRRHRDAGLGDPDDTVHEAAHATAGEPRALADGAMTMIGTTQDPYRSLAEAAAALRREARELGAVLRG
jgi:uncharacterized membrane protein YdbT with pleckstrin-like domain